MGRGEATKRRAKLQQRANQGNLHKAQLGKGGATAFLPLPAAPKKDDYVDKVPRSLRKLLALKAVAEGEPAHRSKSHPGTAAAGGKQPQQPAGQPPLRQQEGLQHAKSTQPGQLPQQPQPQQPPPEPVPAAVAGATIWEQPKRLKAKKKEYLNAKRKKKKGRSAAGDDAEEQQLARVDRPAFGEVVHAPPKVHLKSKHWDRRAAQAQEAERAQQAAARKRRQQAATGAGAKRPRPVQDSQLAEARDAAIERYREGRGGAPREGHATLASLKQLTAAAR